MLGAWYGHWHIGFNVGFILCVLARAQNLTIIKDLITIINQLAEKSFNISNPEAKLSLSVTPSKK